MKPRRLESATILSMVTVSGTAHDLSDHSRPIPLSCGPPGWHSYTGSAMPIYEYRCERGHQFEVMQKMTDDPVQSCTRCEAPVQRVFHPVAVHFKGKGFYNTDYGTRRRNRELERSGKDGAD